MELYTVFDNQVYRAKCIKIPQEFDGEVFRVEIFTTGKSIVRIINTNVGIARSLVSSAIQIDGDASFRPLQVDERYIIAMRAARKFHPGTDGKIVVHTGDIKALFEYDKTDDDVENEVMGIIVQFSRLEPGLQFSEWNILASTFCPKKQVQKALRLFTEAGFLDYGIGLDIQEKGLPHLSKYKLTQNAYKELILKKKKQSITASGTNIYFQVVNIPAIRGVRFAFVLMPFKKVAPDQSIYYEIIKPILQNEKGINCLRADEIGDPGVINNQIYTCINLASIIIAELSTPNRNVDIELGMALQAGKPVYILTEHEPEKLPFDLRDKRVIKYDSKEDLKTKLIENIKLDLS